MQFSAVFQQKQRSQDWWANLERWVIHQMTCVVGFSTAAPLGCHSYCPVSPLPLLHVHLQYGTPAPGILSRCRFCLCGWMRKQHFGLTGLFILEFLLQTVFVTPWSLFSWFKCKQPCKTVPMTEPLTVTQNTLSTSSVGWVVLHEAEQGT